GSAAAGDLHTAALRARALGNRMRAEPNAEGGAQAACFVRTGRSAVRLIGQSGILDIGEGFDLQQGLDQGLGEVDALAFALRRPRRLRGCSASETVGLADASACERGKPVIVSLECIGHLLKNYPTAVGRGEGSSWLTVQGKDLIKSQDRVFPADG